MTKRANERITDTIIKQLEDGTTPPWSKPWRTMAETYGHPADGIFPANHISGKTYSGVNILLLWGAKEEGQFSRNRWMTFKQAKAKGGTVRKGERGTGICFTSTYQKEGNMLDSTGKPIMEDRRFLKTYTVFNLDQIDGLDETPAPQPVANPLRMADFDDMITAVGAELVHGGNRACYMHAPRDLIKMPFFNQFPSADDYYAVLAHELTHWTGAKSRCDRKFGKRFGDSNYAFEELVAELGGAFLCAEYGIDHTSQAAAYMETWLRGMKDHPQMIVSAASLASKALEFIRAEVLAHNEPEALPELPTIQAPGAPAPQMALSL